MTVSELIRHLKLEDPEAQVIQSNEGLAIIDRHRIPKIKKQLFQLPKLDEELLEIKEVPPLESYGYGQLAYAGRKEINMIYEEMGWDWERRFSYILSFNFGKNWCHLFIDFRATLSPSDDDFGIEQRKGEDIVKIPASQGWIPENGQQSILEYEQQSNEYKIAIPERFKNVEYKSSRIPGIEAQKNLLLGANCQVYVYEFLKEFNKELPNFRSSELWADAIYTRKIEDDFLPFDIMMYNNKREAYGAHVGLYLGGGKVLHLSKDNGVPRIETHEAMLTQRKYRYFIGAKRVLVNKLNEV